MFLACPFIWRSEKRQEDPLLARCLPVCCSRVILYGIGNGLVVHKWCKAYMGRRSRMICMNMNIYMNMSYVIDFHLPCFLSIYFYVVDFHVACTCTRDPIFMSRIFSFKFSPGTCPPRIILESGKCATAIPCIMCIVEPQFLNKKCTASTSLSSLSSWQCQCRSSRVLPSSET